MLNTGWTARGALRRRALSRSRAPNHSPQIVVGGSDL